MSGLNDPQVPKFYVLELSSHAVLSGIRTHGPDTSECKTPPPKLTVASDGIWGFLRGVPGPRASTCWCMSAWPVFHGIDSSANWMRNRRAFPLHGSFMHLCQCRFTFWFWANLFPLCSWLQTSGSSALLPCVCNFVTSLLPSPSPANHIWEPGGLAGSLWYDSGTGSLDVPATVEIWGSESEGSDDTWRRGQVGAVPECTAWVLPARSTPPLRASKQE